MKIINKEKARFLHIPKLAMGLIGILTNGLCLYQKSEQFVNCKEDLKGIINELVAESTQISACLSGIFVSLMSVADSCGNIPSKVVTRFTNVISNFSLLINANFLLQDTYDFYNHDDLTPELEKGLYLGISNSLSTGIVCLYNLSTIDKQNKSPALSSSNKMH